MQKSLKADFLAENSVIPAVYDADNEGETIDTKGYGSVLFVANVGAAGITWTTTNKLTLLVQESADDSTWTAVAAADLDGGLSTGTLGEFKVLDDATDASLAYHVGYLGNKRYCRAKILKGGTHSTGSPIGIVALKGNPKYAPAA